MDIGMAVAIFIIALLAMVGTILRVIASCINFIAYLVYSVSNCGANVYTNVLTWGGQKSKKIYD